MNDLVVLKELIDIKIITINQFENTDRDRPEFSNKYLKILYFMLREGIISTFRKYTAHKQSQKRYLTFLEIEYNKEHYLNISVQSQKNPDDFVLRNWFYPPAEINFDQVSENLEYYIEQFVQFADEEHYDIFGINTSYPVSLPVKHKEFEEEYPEGLFIYGLGGYIRMFVIQHFRKNMNKLACVDYKADVTKHFKKTYNFKYSFLIPSGSYTLLAKVRNPVAIIATYHSSHATLAYEIHTVNPNTKIFIEKPPTVTLDDLEKLLELYRKGASIEMGFNRRFIGFSRYIKEKVKDKTVIITCSVKEVLISTNHWYLWKNQGTRVTGNAVHWFDLANYWIDSIPIELNLIAHPDERETLTVSVLYKNGSLLNLTASDKGNSMRGVQEKIEVRFDNETIFINDFMTMIHIKNNGVRVVKRKLRRDKGHNAMYHNFLQIIKEKKQSACTVNDLIRTSVVTYYASKMLKEGIRNFVIEKEIKKYIQE